MKASLLDLRRRTKDILRALERNETVTIFYRGKLKGVIFPAGNKTSEEKSITEHPAFGLWRDRKDMEDVLETVRTMRKGRNSVI